MPERTVLRLLAEPGSGGFDTDFTDTHGRPARLEGIVGIGFAYTFGDESRRRIRVCVQGDESGRAMILSQDAIDYGAELGRRVVEEKVRAHLDALHVSGQRNLADVCGIDPGAALHPNSGPDPVWTDDQYEKLVERVLARQEAGLPPDDFTSGEPWRLEPRSVRAHLQEAERRGKVEIERHPGYKNRYRRPPNTSERPGANPPLAPETVREFRFELERARRVLHKHALRVSERASDRGVS